MRISFRSPMVIALLMVVVIGGVITAMVLTQRAARSDAAAKIDPLTIAADARVLTATPDAKVTVTEFLDFECEACGAMHPIVEKLRDRYGSRVAFTFRYFPLPGHRNSVPAARAVEAAARQGKLEPMYQRLFASQQEWGESTTSQAARFRADAAALGLDLARYDKDLADPTLAARIDRDIALGRNLGITGTPTFFVNGTVVPLQNPGDVESEIMQALER